MMLAAVKFGAMAGMLNHHQSGDVLAHSIGLLDAKVLVAETDLLAPITECGAGPTGLDHAIEEFEHLAENAPTANPAATSAVLAKDKAFYIFTSGTTGMPKASVMTHPLAAGAGGFGGLGLRLNSDDTLYCCLPLYHNNAMTVACRLGDQCRGDLALGRRSRHRGSGTK